jgi:hypothetical protein
MLSVSKSSKVVLKFFSSSQTNSENYQPILVLSIIVLLIGLVLTGIAIGILLTIKRRTQHQPPPAHELDQLTVRSSAQTGRYFLI